jgi:hypothetical protein
MSKVPTCLFGAVDTAIGEQFMCWDCAKGADQPLTPETSHVITRENILETGLYFICERCGIGVDDSAILNFESGRTMPEPEVERFMEETAAMQYADHVAELKERERLGN